MGLERLIVLRHGDYCGKKLNQNGIDQIESISEKIRDIVAGRGVVVLTSTAGRAVHSAEIVSEYLGVDAQPHAILWSDDEHVDDIPGAYDLILSYIDHADVIVVVTHYEYVMDLPEYFANRQLDCNLESRVIEKGHAWDLNCKVPSLELVCPF